MICATFQRFNLDQWVEVTSVKTIRHLRQLHFDTPGQLTTCIDNDTWTKIDNIYMHTPLSGQIQAYRASTPCHKENGLINAIVKVHGAPYGAGTFIYEGLIHGSSLYTMGALAMLRMDWINLIMVRRSNLLETTCRIEYTDGSHKTVSVHATLSDLSEIECILFTTRIPFTA